LGAVFGQFIHEQTTPRDLHLVFSGRQSWQCVTLPGYNTGQKNSLTVPKTENAAEYAKKNLTLQKFSD
jgi:hypothetical protein